MLSCTVNPICLCHFVRLNWMRKTKQLCRGEGACSSTPSPPFYQSLSLVQTRWLPTLCAQRTHMNRTWNLHGIYSPLLSRYITHAHHLLYAFFQHPFSAELCVQQSRKDCLRSLRHRMNWCGDNATQMRKIAWAHCSVCVCVCVCVWVSAFCMWISVAMWAHCKPPSDINERADG